MAHEPVKEVVIVGGGTAGWMTAASLANAFEKIPINITLVESSEIGTVGVGEATIPTIRRFYQSLGLQDYDVMRVTQATCKLGIEFQDWHKQGHSFIHPFGLYGQTVRNVPFHHYWTKLRRAGSEVDIADYCMPINLAKQCKFSPPAPNPPTPLGIFDWALHLDAALFAQLLKEYSVAKGVENIDAKIEQVNLRKTDGFIESLTLDSGGKVTGDLFIDCSGFKGLLIEEALKTGYEDWSHWLKCDSAYVVQTASEGNPAPYTRAKAQKAGWQWRIPLQHREGNGHVFASGYLSDDEAAAILLRDAVGSPLGEPRKLTFTAGRRKQAWNKNCIALGLAAGFLEPLESTSIALIETGIEKILMLFPDQSFKQSVVDEFNEMTRLEYERVRDFIILHYKATQRDDTPFWGDCRELDVPEPLAHKMRLFKDRGHLVKYRWEIFQSPSWIAIYAGYNMIPDAYDSRADYYNDEFLQASFDNIARSIRAGVEAAPTHAEFLARHCAAPPSVISPNK